MSHKVDDAATATGMQDPVSTSRLMPRSTPTTVTSPLGAGTAGGLVPARASTRVTTSRCSDSASLGRLLLTVPVISTSHMLMDWFGYDLDIHGIELVGPVLGFVILLWGGSGWLFLEGGRH